jgi:hypothetical protein
MKRTLFSVLAAIAVFGCAEPVTLEKLPPPDPASAGEVVIVRPSAFIGDDLIYVVNVDKKDVAELRSRQYQRLMLPAGEHRIAIRCFNTLSGWAETAMTQGVAVGKTAYLAVAPKHGCASVDQVPESEAKKLLANTGPRSGWTQ